MRVKPDELGLCHRDGCGEKAVWKALLVLRNTDLKGRTTLWVCDKHKKDAEDYILNNENRSALCALLVDNNFQTIFTVGKFVRDNAHVVFFDPFDEETMETMAKGR